MTVKEFKEWVSKIDSEYDNLEAVLENFQGYYNNGYTPIGILSFEKTEIIDNFPEDKENNPIKNALVLTIA